MKNTKTCTPKMIFFNKKKITLKIVEKLTLKAEFAYFDNFY